MKIELWIILSKKGSKLIGRFFFTKFLSFFFCTGATCPFFPNLMREFTLVFVLSKKDDNILAFFIGEHTDVKRY